MSEVLASVVERPPAWVASLTPKANLEIQSSSDRKGRILQINNPTPATIRATFLTKRKRITRGGSVMFVREDPPVVWVDVGTDSHGYIGTFRTREPEGMRDDHEFGETALSMAQLLVSAGGDVQWGAGWFGWYSAPPLAAGIGSTPAQGRLAGYSYLACFSPEIAARLGGYKGVKASVAETVREVTTASGEVCVVALLRRSPAAVTEALLRDWRQFLSPVLPMDDAERRADAFARMSVPKDDPWYDLPPMVLREDWPSP